MIFTKKRGKCKTCQKPCWVGPYGGTCKACDMKAFKAARVADHALGYHAAAYCNGCPTCEKAGPTCPACGAVLERHPRKPKLFVECAGCKEGQS